MLNAEQLILALDHVRAVQGNTAHDDDNQHKWSERLAVLTHDMLYLLDVDEDENSLSPFGRACERVQLQDVIEVDLITASPETLLISTSQFFDRHTLMRSSPGAAGMQQWRNALCNVVSAQHKLRAAEGVADMAACLGMSDPNSPPRQRSFSNVSLRSNLSSRDSGEIADAAGRAGGSSADGSPAWRRQGAYSCSDGSEGEGTCTAAAGADERHNTNSSSWRPPWAEKRLRSLRALGYLQKRRDGLLLVGWVDRLFVLCSDGVAGTLLYYKRSPEMNDELLGELRGVIELQGATIDMLLLEQAQLPDAPTVPNCQLPDDPACKSKHFLRITAAHEPESQPFYELPKRRAVIDIRFETQSDLQQWLQQLHSTVALLTQRQFPDAADTPHKLLQTLTPSLSCAQASPTSIPTVEATQACSSRTRARRHLFLAPFAGLFKQLQKLPQLLPLVALNSSWLLVRQRSVDDLTLWITLLAANMIAFLLIRQPPPRPHTPSPHQLPLPHPRPISDSSVDRHLTGRAPFQKPSFGFVSFDKRSWWEDGNGSCFRVRCGPDYRRNGEKTPSLACMYTLTGAEFLRTPCRIEHIAELLELPPPLPGAGSQNGRLPPRIVVNVVVPVDPPSFAGDMPDGPSVCASFCFACTPQAQAASLHEDPSPSVKLMAHMQQHADRDRMRSCTFKVIVIVDNKDELGVSKMLHPYNGKPILVCKTGAMYTGSEYIEIDILVHKFRYFAQRGLHSLKPKVADALLHVGFLLQGTEDHELPEQIFGAVRLPRIDYHTFPEIAPEMLRAHLARNK